MKMVTGGNIILTLLALKFSGWILKSSGDSCQHIQKWWWHVTMSPSSHTKLRVQCRLLGMWLPSSPTIKFFQLTLSPVYTIQPVVKLVWQTVKCLYTRYTIVYTNIQPVVKPVWQLVERTVAVRSTRLWNWVSQLVTEFHNWLSEQWLFVGSRPSDHYFRSVCLFVCLCRVFLSRLWSDFD